MASAITLALLLCGALLSPSALAAPSHGLSALRHLSATPAGNVSTYKYVVDCLKQNGVTTISGSDGQKYDEARKSFSKFFHYFPSAVVYPNNTEQVKAAIKCAVQFDVQVHPRCGNHANEGETVSTGDITLDLTRMNAVSLAPDMKTATVQGGATVGQAVGAIWVASNGTRVLPGGQRPVVGIGGYALGGGFGALVRYAGLASDNIISLNVVDAKGNDYVVDAKHHADLLWALRGGGGGNLVVVTSFTFRTIDVSKGITALAYTPPRSEALAVLSLYQDWITTLDNRFTLLAEGPTLDTKGQHSVLISGWCVGSAAECMAAIRASGVPQTINFTYEHSDFVTAFINQIGWPVPNGVSPIQALTDPAVFEDWRSFYKYKSLLLSDRLNNQSIETLLEFARINQRYVETIDTPGPDWAFEFQALGGAMRAVPEGATATANIRKADQVLIIRAGGNPEMNETVSLVFLHEASRVLQKLQNSLPSYKAYINFMDTDVPAFADWRDAYYGDDLETLRCVKTKYDPRPLFQLPLDYHMSTSRSCKALLRTAARKAAAYSKQLLSNLM